MQQHCFNYSCSSTESLRYSIHESAYAKKLIILFVVLITKKGAQAKGQCVCSLACLLILVSLSKHVWHVFSIRHNHDFLWSRLRAQADCLQNNTPLHYTTQLTSK